MQFYYKLELCGSLIIVGLVFRAVSNKNKMAKSLEEAAEPLETLGVPFLLGNATHKNLDRS
jgi:hypothetical protein